MTMDLGEESDRPTSHSPAAQHGVKMELNTLVTGDVCVLHLFTRTQTYFLNVKALDMKNEYLINVLHL